MRILASVVPAHSFAALRQNANFGKNRSINHFTKANSYDRLALAMNYVLDSCTRSLSSLPLSYKEKVVVDETCESLLGRLGKL